MIYPRTRFRSLKDNLRTLMLRRGVNPCIFVSGFPKSGTSAVASILAETCKLNAKIDFPRLITDQRLAERLINGEVNIHKEFQGEMSYQLIKEPMLTLAMEQVKLAFPLAHIIHVQRSYQENIQSFLGRLGYASIVSHDFYEYQGRNKLIAKSWNRILEHSWKGAKPYSFENLLDAKQIFDSRGRSSADIFVRYEKFTDNKVEAISKILDQLHMQAREVLPSVILDRQYQPSSTKFTSEKFFSDEQMSLIHEYEKTAV